MKKMWLRFALRFTGSEECARRSGRTKRKTTRIVQFVCESSIWLSKTIFLRYLILLFSFAGIFHLILMCTQSAVGIELRVYFVPFLVASTVCICHGFFLPFAVVVVVSCYLPANWKILDAISSCLVPNTILCFHSFFCAVALVFWIFFTYAYLVTKCTFFASPSPSQCSLALSQNSMNTLGPWLREILEKETTKKKWMLCVEYSAMNNRTEEDVGNWRWLLLSENYDPAYEMHKSKNIRDVCVLACELLRKRRK